MKLLERTGNKITKDSRVLYTFVPNKPFVSLLEISPTNHILSNHITSQNSQPLEIEDRINLTLVIK